MDKTGNKGKLRNYSVLTQIFKRTNSLIHIKNPSPFNEYLLSFLIFKNLYYLHGLLMSKILLNKPSTKLQNWPSLDFKEFLGEFVKAKVKMRPSEEAERMTYFDEQKEKALALQTEINHLEAEIDQMVYELYGLNKIFLFNPIRGWEVSSSIFLFPPVSLGAIERFDHSVVFFFCRSIDKSMTPNGVKPLNSHG